MIINEDAYLAHYGVLGMKWGRRKGNYSANELSSRQKEKAGKKYKKQMTKAINSVNRKNTDHYVEAHNRASVKFNEKINSYRGPAGKKYYKFVEDLENDFTADRDKILTNLKLDHIKNNKNYIKSQKLVEKYDMVKYDDLVKENIKARKMLESLAK